MTKARIRIAAATITAAAAGAVTLATATQAGALTSCTAQTPCLPLDGGFATSLPTGQSINVNANATDAAFSLFNNSTDPSAEGIYSAARGHAVIGESTGSGSGTGVWGLAASPAANTYGVFGVLNQGSPGLGAAGVWGRSFATNDAGSGTVGEHYEPTGSGAGLFGQTYSTSDNSVGTYGLVIPTNAGAGSAGVVGRNNATNGNGYGVWGRHNGSGIGVAGQSSTGIGTLGYSSGIGVLGYNTSASGVAGYFRGNVTVTGTLTKGAGAFRIDHPLDPAHKYLQHSFVESPDMKDVYDGVVRTDRRGFATVQLPAWFQALNKDFRYQLTSLSGLQEVAVAKEIAHNRFTIQSQKPHSRVSWQVTGIRHDPYANAHRIQTVVEKPAGEQGKYLHAELYGQPRSKTIGRLPATAFHPKGANPR